jgi:branched-chain amino acid aminotransferase
VKIYIDGTLYAAEDGKVPVLDRGFLLGLGVRESFVCRAGKFYHLDGRLGQMRAVAQEFGVAFPEDVGALKEALAVTYDMNGFDGREALLELILSGGGEPERTEETPKKEGRAKKKELEKLPTVPTATVIIPREWVPPTVPLEEVSLALLDPSPVSGEAVLRERNLLGAVGTTLARTAAKAKEAEEALLVDGNGFVTACTGGEVFIVRDSCILTPEFTVDTFRRNLLSTLLADMGHACTGQRLKLRDFAGASECFFLTDLRAVRPVSALDGKSYGDGKAGPVASALAPALTEKLEADSSAPF